MIFLPEIAYLHIFSKPIIYSMRSNIILLLILLLSAVLRFGGLGTESLWLDEAITANHMKSGFIKLIHDYIGNTQTIMYYLIEKVWCVIFGLSEVALRFPSAAFGILTVWAIFLLARQMFSEKAALWSAFLLAINPFAIYYSQEARPYALFLLAAVFSLYFLHRYLHSPGKKSSAWGYVISSNLAFWTHPLGPFLLIVHLTMAALFRNSDYWRSLRRTAVLMAIAFALYLPQLALMWTAIVDTAEHTGAASWIPRPSLKVFLETWQQYFMSPYLAGFSATLLILVIAIFVRRDRAGRKGLYVCAMLFTAFIPFVWIVSHILAPLYVHRFTIPALAAVLLGLGWSFAAMKLRWRIAAVFIYLLLTAQALFAYYTKTDKDPWRRTAQIIREIVQPGDAIVIHMSFAKLPLKYYLPTSNEVLTIAPWFVHEIPAAIDTVRRIVFVSSYLSTHRDITDTLYARSARNRETGPSVRINDLAPQNPWGYWITDISVATYSRKE